jgi:RNA polymerase sigma-70 factor (ECF subfamily)
MMDHDALANQFERQRPRLRRVAYRMLGSLIEADDAVQETWLRLSRADSDGIHNLCGWLTTVVGRVCLDMLRARTLRREQPEGRATRVYVPDPIVIPDDAANPEDAAIMSDAIGLGLLVVLDRLTPAERLAFVLHDVFGVPFEEIAPIVDRTPVAARKLASRARLRVRGAPTLPDTHLARQHALVDAFLAAARGGDFEALLAILDPDVELRADYGAVGRKARGNVAVAKEAREFARLSAAGLIPHRAVVNGGAGRVVYRKDKLFSVMGFTIAREKIVAIHILVDSRRLRALDLPVAG